MQWHGQPTGRRGRSPTFSDAAIQFCLSIKGLFGLPLRQVIGFVQSLMHLTGLDWPVPDYSTGVKMLGEGEWKTKKHGAEYRRQWRKVHLGIDAETLEIRAIEVNDNRIGDAPMLPELLK